MLSFSNQEQHQIRTEDIPNLEIDQIPNFIANVGFFLTGECNVSLELVF